MQLIPTRSFVKLGAPLLAAALALGLSASAHAQWKWRDQNNRVQYSDVPPPSSVPDKDILQRPPGSTKKSAPVFVAPPASGASAGASGPLKTTDPELEARRKKAEQDEAAKRKADDDKNKAVRAENCARAKTQLATLESGQRMARVGANGEREVYDDKIRAEETKRTRDIMAAECK
ncbi:MAG: hypothetical protein RLZZ618_3745 [Pseudomonadota bacterium]|jgi:hypothetical protein